MADAVVVMWSVDDSDSVPSAKRVMWTVAMMASPNGTYTKALRARPRYAIIAERANVLIVRLESWVD